MIKSFLKSKRPKSPKDGMIQYVTEVLTQKKNEKIRATLTGFETPQRVVRKATGKGYIPEVTAVKHKQFRLFAIETKETLADEDTENRWKLFAEYAGQSDALFYIVFPTGMVAQVKEKLEALNIEASLWQAPRR